MELLKAVGVELAAFALVLGFVWLLFRTVGRRSLPEQRWAAGVSRAAIAGMGLMAGVGGYALECGLADRVYLGTSAIAIALTYLLNVVMLTSLGQIALGRAGVAKMGMIVGTFMGIQQAHGILVPRVLDLIARC